MNPESSSLRVAFSKSLSWTTTIGSYSCTVHTVQLAAMHGGFSLEVKGLLWEHLDNSWQQDPMWKCGEAKGYDPVAMFLDLAHDLAGV